MGVNVVYAPSCDLATNPANPHLGIRSFGDDPAAVGAFAAAMVRGIRSAGAAATIKHFPGLGEADLDTHLGLPDLGLGEAALAARELVPFAAAIEAGADMVMSAHVALSPLTGSAELPGDAGPRGDARPRARAAGVPRPDDHRRPRHGGAPPGRRPGDRRDRRAPGRQRPAAVRPGPAQDRPDRGRGRRMPPRGACSTRTRCVPPRAGSLPCGCASPMRRSPTSTSSGGAPHQALARDVAERSITLVRDRDGLLPLRPEPGGTVLAVMPRPAGPHAGRHVGLGRAGPRRGAPRRTGRTCGRSSRAIRRPPTRSPPSSRRPESASITVVGSIAASADPAQAALVDALLDARPRRSSPSRCAPRGTSAPTRGRARTSSPTASFGPTLAALAATLFGERPFRGGSPSGCRPALLEDVPAPMTLRDEIHEQPEAIARLVDRASAFGRIGARLHADQLDHVLIAARGTSDHAAIYAQYLFGIQLGMPVGLATPSILSVYGAELRLARTLVIGISQSGASPDIVGVLEEGRRAWRADGRDHERPRLRARGCRRRGDRPRRRPGARGRGDKDVHGRARGPRAARGRDPRPRGPAACRSRATRRARARSRRRCATEPEVAAAAAGLADRAACVVVGRGYEYATAREWALKLKELAHVVADPYSAADFRHGPVALVDEGFPVLAIAPSGKPAADMAALLERLRDELGASVLVLSDVPETRALGTSAVALPTARGAPDADRLDRVRPAPRAPRHDGAAPRPGPPATHREGDPDRLRNDEPGVRGTGRARVSSAGGDRCRRGYQL